MTLAKLRPPAAAGLMPRERLFARLDTAVARRLVWITAPAGAGKGSLAATWLAARGTRSLWYRVDADDADPATFFHYLARAAAEYGVELPALTPEYLPGLATFTRRFFRTLFEAMPTPFVLVLDKLHAVPPDAPLHGLIAVAAEELPTDAALLVLSRLAPSSPHARFFMTGAFLGWEDLRFSVAETRALLRAHGAGDAAEIQAATHGWAAGIAFATSASGMRAVPPDPEQESRAVFDYIATEIYDPLPAERREFLLRAGMLPVMTAGLCVAVSGDRRGFVWLAEFQRDHLFVSQYAEPERSYEFCPLFRAFLRHRIEMELPAPERRQLARRVALALEQADLINDAAEIWLAAEAWTELARLLCAQAPAWLATGRHAALLAWLERLPAPMRAAAPWLMFWSAACRVMNDPAAARADFERAFAAFKAADDLAGQWLTWAGIAETFVFGWDSLAGFDPWIAELESLLARQRRFPSPDVEARVLAGGVALMFRRPDHPLLQHWAERALALIRGKQVLPHTAMLAHFAGFYHMWRGHTHTLDAVLQAVRVIDVPAPPLARILMGLLELVLANFRGDTASVESALDSALAVAAEHGVRVMDVPLIQNAGLAALARGHTERLEALIRMARPALLPGRWLEASFQEYLEGGLALLRGDMVTARARISTALALLADQGMPLLEIHTRLFLAHLDILERRGAVADAGLEVILRQARAASCDLFVAAALLARARLGLDSGDAAAADSALREALSIGATWNYGHLFLHAAPAEEGRLCARALEQNIEPAYVRRLIRQRDLTPPDSAVNSWPWPVRIHALGRFSILIDAQPLTVSGKGQKRPLQLLKALLALGPRGVNADELARVLWRDEGGADARHALEMATSRLRRLLGSEDALQVRDGKLSLNEKRVWVDVRVFERLTREAESARADPRQAGEAFRRYTGSFLSEDGDIPWLLARRQRLRARYIQLVANYGKYLEQEGDWSEALAAYRRALEFEPLEEGIYRRLMHAHIARGEHAQALEVFRRCRELLSIVLGVAPSAATQALAARARARAG